MLVELKGVVKYYGNTVVLNGVNLTVSEGGDFVAVFGRSGVGKTTLLNIIGGLLRADAGSVVVLGIDLVREFHRALELRRRDLVIVHENLNLIGSLSNIDNIMLPLLRLGVESRKAREIAVSVSRELGLNDDVLRRTPGKVSMGQRRRVALARALALEPRILIVDEPTANVDAETAEMVLTVMKDLVSRGGKAVIMATHDKEALKYSNKNYTLINGKLIAT